MSDLLGAVVVVVATVCFVIIASVLIGSVEGVDDE